jgi:proline iminopeptidase
MTTHQCGENNTDIEYKVESFVMRYRILGLLIVFILLATLVACQTSEEVVSEFDVQASDVRLHARMTGNPGSGCVLIAINGGPGLTSSYMWDLEQLGGDDCAVVTYDQRGVGKSGEPVNPDSLDSYTLLKYAEDLEAVRQAIGVGRVHLMGHSFGGIVAMQYAVSYPEHVASLIFFGSGPPTWEGIETSQRNFSDRLVSLIQKEVIPPPEEWEDNGIDPLLPAYFSDPTFTFPEGARGAAPEFDQMVSDLTYPNLDGMDLRDELALLQLPVLLMFGEDDPFGVQMAEAVGDALENADVDFVVIDDCGHFWHECPDAFYPRVEVFLEKHSQ